ncbi:acyltransferase [Flavobacterium defluvii]|uniref:Galactoside O-acetyltransferase n=1 Tax=Flavobacterium defluvii TaxID=370979 RepID=A0A1M5NUS5_9FLAO|nr:acyltransferase [Flavobacterium defluvii]SHG93260.1 galactoside O-acetyltransferase [Flavobacterium defluvii]
MIRRVLNILKKKKVIETSLVKYKNYFTKEDSTFMKNSNIRFDVPGKIENRKYITIGEKGIINANFIFESEKGEVIIGNNVHLGGVTFISRNRIEVHDDVTMAWGITIYDHNSHSIYWEERKNDNHQCYDDYVNCNGNNVTNKNWSIVADAPIIIESKVWIGFDVTILKGVKIGEGAVVGAKSVVTKNVEPWTVVAGNPAVVVKYLPEYNRNQ